MAGNEIKGDMIRGHVDTFILLALTDGDKDSNDIKSAIEERSENKFTVKQGTFYSAMQRLVKQNYIKEYRSSAADGIRRKYYSLTDKGKKSLDKSRDEWTKSKELIDNIIDTPPEPEKPKNTVTKIEFDEFDEFKKLADENAQDYSFAAPDLSDDDYLDRIGEEVLNDLNEELNAVNTTNDSANDDLADSEKSIETDTDEISIYDEILPPDDDELLTDASDEMPQTDETDLSEIPDENIDNTNPVNEYHELKNDTDAQPETAVQYDVNEINDNPADETINETSIVYEFELPPEDNETEQTDGDSSTRYDSENITKSSEITDENYSVSENSDNIGDGEDVVSDKSTGHEDLPYAQNNEETQTIQNKPVTSDVTSETNDSKKKDDSLYVEDGKPTNRREYKSILGKLFPKDEEELQENDNQKVVSTKQIDIDEYASEAKKYNEEDFGTKNDELPLNEPSDYEKYKQQFGSDNYEQSETVERERVKTEKKVGKENVTVQSADYDFSDLYKMAKNEGFKVRTSLSTNKFNGSGIFLNKLNFHASLLSYFLLFVEMLILNFSLSGVLGWSFTVKAIIAGVPALLPFVTFIIYLIAPKRKVREISQFRDAITVFLIVTFQLIIIDLCVALFMEVDFNNVKEVLTYLVVPFILIINIPLFAIVKYTLLDTGKYFDEIKE